jgi:leucyl-tRNA synthetase
MESEKSFDANDNQVRVSMHKTIKKVTDDMRRLSFNTAIAAMMEFTNDLYKYKVDGFSEKVWGEALRTLTQLLAPFAPHMADELWSQLGGETLVQHAGWPVWDESLIVEETMTIAVQVNGKLRGEISVAADADEEAIKSDALAHENVTKFVGDHAPKKIIYVKGRLVNIVL